MRFVRAASALTLLCLLAGSASADVPTLTADPDTIRADSTNVWHVALMVHNPLDWGLYPDSLELRFEDQDPGATGGPRVNTQRMDGLIKAMEAVSGHETAPFDWTGSAQFERGRISVRVWAHDAQKHPFVLDHMVVVRGSDLADRYPSSFVGSGAHKVELVLVPSTAAPAPAPAPAPGVLLVHGHGANARRMLRVALLLSSRGWNVALVSQPGYGESSGPPDMMGPATVDALGEALEALKKLPESDPKRLAVWGISRGATAALLLAARRTDLCGVVAQSGAYDLWSVYRGSAGELRANIEREAGRDSAAWRARSPIFVADKIRCAVLVLHGQRDDTAPVADARAFIAAREAKKLPVESDMPDASGHRLVRMDATRQALEFLTRLCAH